MLTLHKQADNTIKVKGLHRTDTDDFVPKADDPNAADNAATITMTLKDSVGANVTGAVNLSVPYVAESNGNYVGVIPSSASMVAGTGQTLTFTIIFGDLDRVIIEDVTIVNP